MDCHHTGSVPACGRRPQLGHRDALSTDQPHVPHGRVSQPECPALDAADQLRRSARTATKSLDETLAIFSDPEQKVSAHFVVDKDGTVVQTVPAQNRAWHAGVSRLGNETGVNDFSVGIEMVNADDGRDPYTDRQYAAVAAIIRLLRTQCSIPDNRIVTHAQIALPPGRKQDPIGFDMDRVRNEAKG